MSKTREQQLLEDLQKGDLSNDLRGHFEAHIGAIDQKRDFLNEQLAQLKNLGDNKLNPLINTITEANNALTFATLFPDIEYVTKLKDIGPQFAKLDENINIIKNDAKADQQALLGQIQITLKTIARLTDYEQVLKNKITKKNSDTTSLLRGLNVSPEEAKQVHLERELKKEEKGPVTTAKSVKDRAAAFEQAAQKTVKPTEPQPDQPEPTTPRMRK